MKLIENRLVGENTFENDVLRNIIEERLREYGDYGASHGALASNPGETGIMAVMAEWCYGSLECEVWIEAESDDVELNPEDFEYGDLFLAYKWRTPEREGHWCELGSIIKRNDQEGTHGVAEHSG